MGGDEYVLWENSPHKLGKVFLDKIKGIWVFVFLNSKIDKGGEKCIVKCCFSSYPDLQNDVSNNKIVSKFLGIFLSPIFDEYSFINVYKWKKVATATLP